MRTDPLRTLAPLLAGVLLAASALAQPQEGQAARVIGDDEMRRYLGVFDRLVDFGLEAGPMVSAMGSGGSAGQAAAVRYSERMQAVIEGGGFTLESFTDVHWNAMRAWAAAEMQAHRAELDAARREQAAQLEAMRSQLPPEQYAQMTRALEGLTALGAFDDVPAENVALVERHRAELERILEKGERPR